MSADVPEHYDLTLVLIVLTAANICGSAFVAITSSVIDLRFLMCGVAIEMYVLLAVMHGSVRVLRSGIFFTWANVFITTAFLLLTPKQIISFAPVIVPVLDYATEVHAAFLISVVMDKTFLVCAAAQLYLAIFIAKLIFSMLLIDRLLKHAKAKEQNLSHYGPIHHENPNHMYNLG